MCEALVKANVMVTRSHLLGLKVLEACDRDEAPSPDLIVELRAAAQAVNASLAEMIRYLEAGLTPTPGSKAWRSMAA